MEALREVNKTLTEVLNEIEIYMFIENISISDDNNDSNNYPDMLFENKMVD
jgi:hypothetical protein